SPTLTVTAFTPAAHGTASIAANGALTYTPVATFSGADSFTYTVSDGQLSSTATVTVNVTATNHPPAAADDSYATNEDTTLTVTAPGVLGNDTDSDNDPLTAVLVSGPVHGSLTLSADGSFSYAPAADYNGGDSFTYKAFDGQAFSNVATVSLT